MVTTTAIGATSESPALERYRAAERELWAHYGLKPQERFVESAHAHIRIGGPDGLRRDEPVVGERRRHADVDDRDVGLFAGDDPKELLRAAGDCE